MLSRRVIFTSLLFSQLFPTGSLYGETIPFSRDYLDTEALLEQGGHYLPAYIQAKNALMTARGDDLNFALEMFGMIAARVGDEDGALLAEARRWPPTARNSPDLSDYIAEDALDTISRAAVNRRIVILNEAHYSSRCRAFGAELAERLAEGGFSIFAAEDFSTGRAETKLNAGAPVTRDLGVCISDPQFAEMVRRARAAGMTFREYEQSSIQSTDRSIMAREDAEATNLIRILDGEPNARIFVYCGYAHAMKAPYNGHSWMAAVVKQRTGVDPLCIDQTEGLPHDNPADESSALTAILGQFLPNRPIVVKAPSGTPYELGNYRNRVDFSVFHPRLPKVGGRPGWLNTGGRRRLDVHLPQPRTEQVLVQAVPWVRPLDSAFVIPADQVVANPDTHTAVLFVRPGRYILRIETVTDFRTLGSVSVD